MNCKAFLLCVTSIVLLLLQACGNGRIVRKISEKETITMSPWCMTRTYDENPSTYQFFAPEKSDWETTRTGKIHRDHNMEEFCKSPGSPCSLRVGDRFLIEHVQGSTKKFRYKRNPVDLGSLGNKDPESVEVELGANPFLVGRLKWDGVEKADIFILFSGVGACRELKDGEPWMATEECKLYTIEIFPDQLNSTWGDYKPNGDKVTWEQGYCRPVGSEAKYLTQPGGGDGHDPP